MRVLRFFVCRRCKENASIEEVSEVMSVVGCIKCEVFEVLSHSNLEPLDHFSFLDVPEAGGEWKN